MSTAIDPVCGMNVNPDKTPWKTIYRGKVYYFCSKLCLEEFKRDPEYYLRHGPKGMPGHKPGEEHSH
ncbi:YHS domain-containing protein [Pyrolobus fumarii 1A]|uniref:YHS domain-containing protein n=1 Tax=Pyrolobus fumarii (strain DSM 11204 / 1A) TaxID=694429 RepID=G0EFE2_PYRF1|nr:YHS domain-containing protein [Pyrolobus fumarii]AEM38185.1 YHS domain-containing protein [Pyrolobus fumarii 1A]